MVEGESPLKLNGKDMDVDAEQPSTQRVRVLSLPKFRETGELVLVDTESLEVEVVKFGGFSGKEEQK